MVLQMVDPVDRSPDAPLAVSHAPLLRGSFSPRPTLNDTFLLAILMSHQFV